MCNKNIKRSAHTRHGNAAEYKGNDGAWLDASDFFLNMKMLNGYSLRLLFKFLYYGCLHVSLYAHVLKMSLFARSLKRSFNRVL